MLREIPCGRPASRRLVALLHSLDCDAIHTLDLPAGNATTDREVCDIADRDERIVVTKDRDFRNSHLLLGRPQRLLHVTAGNITNAELLALISGALDDLNRAFEAANFVEISSDGLVIHAHED